MIHRSCFLEEYSSKRPASAGVRPRSLLNKIANAAQLGDVSDNEEVDTDTWILEGWGEEPSVVSLSKLRKHCLRDDAQCMLNQHNTTCMCMVLVNFGGGVFTSALKKCEARCI